MFIDITIAGVTPLLMNRFTEEAQMAATSNTSSSSAGREHGTPRAQAEKKIYLDQGKNVVIPQPNLLRCIMEGGRFFKVGKKQVTTQKSSLIPACVDIPGVTLKLAYREPWDIDTRPVRIPSTGGRILCHRPIFHEWSVSFECDLDTTILNQKLFRDIVDAAGKRIGLGDFRPDTKGPFGKFVVTTWTEQKEENGT
jgi:hypothetical protein